MSRSPEEIERRRARALEVPLLRFLGASLLDGREPQAAVSLALTEKALNAVGALHGGVIATILDVAAYIAVLPELTPEEEAVTHAFAGSYIAAPEAGQELRATGSLLRRTRRLAFVSAELRSDEKLLALATVTKSVRA